MWRRYCRLKLGITCVLELWNSNWMSTMWAVRRAEWVCSEPVKIYCTWQVQWSRKMQRLRGLPGGCKVSSVTGTYWMEAYCQRRNVVDRVLHPLSALSPGPWCQNGRPSPCVNHIFHKSRSNPKISGTRRVTCSNLYAEDPQRKSLVNVRRLPNWPFKALWLLYIPPGLTLKKIPRSAHTV
jgi:hypothetical protein